MSDDDRPSALALALDEVRRRSVRGLKRAIRPLWMQRLASRNAASRESLLDPAGPVLSLTTYGARLAGVHYTIESIGAGSVRPSRLMLWIGHDLLAAGLPEPLQRLQQRGLEVHGCRDLGPHTKYFHAMNAVPGDRALVTADDDILYPRDWLARLVTPAAREPQFVHCHRAHVMTFGADGTLALYETWPVCHSTRPSFRHFLTGVGGVIHPPAMQAAVRAAGDAFMACCPRQDDIWLTAVAFRAGIKIRQTSPFHPVLFELPGTRSGGLARHNVQGGGNEAQLRATFSDAELATLRQAD
jgi:hypothetical protein